MMKHSASKVTAPILILIDGDCNLCHHIARFVIKRDPHKKFMFASLQSELGQRLLKQGGLSTEDFDTFVMVSGSQYYTKSGAALRVVKHLKGVWPLLYVGILLPRPLRDWMYDQIAMRRHRLFGRSDACMLPTKDTRSRFVEWDEKGDDPDGT